MNAMKQSNRFPHVYWIDLHNNGMAVECCVVKRDTGGNTFFIQLNKLDEIDLSRLLNILRNRNANNFELWDLMSQVTLGNGINALNYFHQVVEVLSPSGQITRPTAGQTGVQIKQAPTPEPTPTPQRKTTTRKKSS
jgi:hypothetical protein